MLDSNQQQTSNKISSLSQYRLYRELKPALIALLLAIAGSATAEEANLETTEEASPKKCIMVIRTCRENTEEQLSNERITEIRTGKVTPLSPECIAEIRTGRKTAVLTYDHCDMTQGIPALKGKYCWMPIAPGITQSKDPTTGEMRDFEHPRIKREEVVDMVKKALGDDACEALVLVGVTGTYLVMNPPEAPQGNEPSIETMWRRGAKKELINKLQEHAEATNATLETLRSLLRQDRVQQNQPPPFIPTLKAATCTGAFGALSLMRVMTSGYADSHYAMMFIYGGAVMLGGGLVVGISAACARFFRLSSGIEDLINARMRLRENEVLTLSTQVYRVNQLLRRIRA